MPITIDMPPAMVQEARLRNARRILLGGVSNVNETARMTGFDSAAYFIKKFKAAFGQTPLKWMRGSASE